MRLIISAHALSRGLQATFGEVLKVAAGVGFMELHKTLRCGCFTTHTERMSVIGAAFLTALYWLVFEECVTHPFLRSSYYVGRCLRVVLAASHAAGQGQGLCVSAQQLYQQQRLTIVHPMQGLYDQQV